MLGGPPLFRRYFSHNILPALHASLVWQHLPGVCWQRSVLVAVVTQEQCGMQRALQNTAPPNDALPLTPTKKGPLWSLSGGHPTFPHHPFCSIMLPSHPQTALGPTQVQASPYFGREQLFSPENNSYKRPKRVLGSSLTAS